MLKKIILHSLDGMNNKVEENGKKNVKENIEIFSSILSLKKGKENRRKKKGKLKGKFHRPQLFNESPPHWSMLLAWLPIINNPSNDHHELRQPSNVSENLPSLGIWVPMDGMHLSYPKNMLKSMSLDHIYEFNSLLVPNENEIMILWILLAGIEQNNCIRFNWMDYFPCLFFGYAHFLKSQTKYYII